MAEYLLEQSMAPGKKSANLINAWVAAAQVHATLAQADALNRIVTELEPLGLCIHGDHGLQVRRLS